MLKLTPVEHLQTFHISGVSHKNISLEKYITRNLINNEDGRGEMAVFVCKPLKGVKMEGPEGNEKTMLNL
jgi:hypothetical protein